MTTSVVTQEDIEDNLKNIKYIKNKQNTPYFARHETFHPRFGWLKKGFDKFQEDKDVFAKEDGPVVLGVGKNMVRAIRYWCIAFKIIDEKILAGNKHYYEILPFAEKLFASDGWDPYLEDIASLWLLHWRLMEERCYATAWYFAFNFFHRMEFTSDELFNELVEYKERKFQNSTIVNDSLNKDVNCILRMYSDSKNAKSFVEDTIDCPFIELGLIQQTSDLKHYTFNIGKKLSLPDEIILYACLQFAFNISADIRSISISRLLYDEGSPGQIFKLTQTSLCEAIESISSKNKEISLSDTAGVIQLFYTDNPKIIADRILDNYYSERKNHVVTKN